MTRFAGWVGPGLTAWSTSEKALKGIKHRQLALHEFDAGCSEVEPLRVIDFGEGLHPSGPWRPFGLERVAVDRLGIEIALGRKHCDALARRLPELAEERV